MNIQTIRIAYSKEIAGLTVERLSSDVYRITGAGSPLILGTESAQARVNAALRHKAIMEEHDENNSIR